MSQVTMYGLKHRETGHLLGFSSERGGDEFCVSVEYDLEKTSNNVWLVPNRQVAEKAANTNPDWYAQGYETPGNSYLGELEVAEVKLTF